MPAKKATVSVPIRSSIRNKGKHPRDPSPSPDPSNDGTGTSSGPVNKKARKGSPRDVDDAAESDAKQEDSESDVAKVEEEELRDPMIAIVKRGVVPVDPWSDLVDTHLVYANKKVVWDAMLNQVDLVRHENKNRFYVLQVLHPATPKGEYYLFTRWGRVGTTGQRKFDGPWSAATAVREFKKQFRSKTGVDWEKRVGMIPGKGKYTWIERDHDHGDDQKSDDVVPNSKFEPDVQRLFRQVFSTGIMNALSCTVHYDTEKLPLGKLARSTIRDAVGALDNLAEVIERPKGEKARANGGFLTACQTFSSLYYTLVPHASGRNPPPVIGNEALLHKERDLIKVFLDEERYSRIAYTTQFTDDTGNALHPLDMCIQSLGSTLTISPIKSGSKEFKGLETCAQETYIVGPTHAKMSIITAYRVERPSETAAWKGRGYDKLADGNRLLLWFGTKAESVSVLLRDGLRTEPLLTIPHGVPRRYKAGSAIYLHDMMAEAAVECGPNLSKNLGFYFLCETVVQPSLEPREENWGIWNAEKEVKGKNKLSVKINGHMQPSGWQDGGAALDNDELRGCEMTKGVGKKVQGRKVFEREGHNTYGVYDAGQIEHIGRVSSIIVDAGGCTLTIGDSAVILGDCHIGDSIAVDGACLTVTEFDVSKEGGWFKVWLANETLERTDLGERKVGDQVNLERAMGTHGRFGGHFVQAHVDGTATVVERVADGDSLRLEFELGDRTLLPCLIEKGYVAIDGASLTVTGVDDTRRRFGVMLIQHTQEKITLGRKEVGSKVNIEVDMVGKYVAKSVAARS